MPRRGNPDLARAQRVREGILEPLRDVLVQLQEVGDPPDQALRTLAGQRGMEPAEATETVQQAVRGFRGIAKKAEDAGLLTQQTRQEFDEAAGDAEVDEAKALIELIDEIDLLLQEMEAAGLDVGEGAEKAEDLGSAAEREVAAIQAALSCPREEALRIYSSRDRAAAFEAARRGE